MKKLIKVIVIVAIIFLLIGGGLGIYAHNYYHADSKAKAAISQINKQDDVYDSQTVESGGFGVLKSNQWLEVAPDGWYESAKEEGVAHAGYIGVILYPGAKVDYKAYAPVAKAIADEGLLCVIPKMPLNIALLSKNEAGEIMAAHPEVSEWIIGGHSLGGVAAASFVEDNNEDVAGVFFLGSYPNNSLKKLECPCVAIYGDQDKVLNMDKYNENKRNFPKDTKEKIIKGGNHAQFGSYGSQKGDGKASITPEKQQKETVKEIMQLVQ